MERRCRIQGFDYRTLEFDYSLLDGYREIRLLAWSMGVWVAGQILSGRTYPWEMKLAVNGTPFPIDDRRGIAEAVFHGTLENFSDAALARFRRRICGGAGQVREFLSHQPYRTTEELGAELAALEHVWAKLPGGRTDSMAFCEELMEKAGVVVTPGASFGPSGEGHVRMALVLPPDQIALAVEAIREAGLY